MPVRGVRGATVANENQTESILYATRELLRAIMEANPTMDIVDIGSVFFTVSDDLDATYPALAARQIGWHQVPMLCGREIPVPQSLPKCIRVLIQWNTEIPQDAIQHIYLGQASSLRPDLPKRES